MCDTYDMVTHTHFEMEVLEIVLCVSIPHIKKNFRLVYCQFANKKCKNCKVWCMIKFPFSLQCPLDLSALWNVFCLPGPLSFCPPVSLIRTSPRLGQGLSVQTVCSGPFLPPSLCAWLSDPPPSSWCINERIELIWFITLNSGFWVNRIIIHLGSHHLWQISYEHDQFILCFSWEGKGSNLSILILLVSTKQQYLWVNLARILQTLNWNNIQIKLI